MKFESERGVEAIHKVASKEFEYPPNYTITVRLYSDDSREVTVESGGGESKTAINSSGEITTTQVDSAYQADKMRTDRAELVQRLLNEGALNFENID